MLGTRTLTLAFASCVALLASLAGAQSKVPEKVPNSDTMVIVTDLTPKQGKLADLLKGEIAKAAKLHRTPFVQLGATWCGPCHDLESSLSDKRMIDAFASTYIIHLDVDAWKGELETFGYSADGIPAFFAIDTTGKATGPSITGGAWAENTVENMAPPLRKFFSEHLRPS